MKREKTEQLFYTVTNTILFRRNENFKRFNNFSKKKKKKLEKQRLELSSLIFEIDIVSWIRKSRKIGLFRRMLIDVKFTLEHFEILFPILETKIETFKIDISGENSFRAVAGEMDHYDVT